MKPDKIYSIFRKADRINLYNAINDDGEIKKQYISDGVCIYALDNLPIFSEATLGGLLGLDSNGPCKVQEDVASQFVLNAMSDIYSNYDIPLKIEDNEFFDLIVMDTCYDKSEQVLHFVDPAYIKPFDKDDSITFASRDIGGQRLIVVQNGFFVVAAIMPMRFLEVKNYADITAKVYKELQRQGNKE
ncbi:MAG: hypothetical protein ACI4J6_04075 [Oscillospiraceae bacterium]